MAITFLETDPDSHLVYLAVASPLSVEGGLSSFPYAWGSVPWGSLDDSVFEISTKVYLSTEAFFTTAADTYPNRSFLPRLRQPFNFSQTIPIPGTGRSRGRTGIGAVRIANGDGALDAELIRAWPGRPLDILVGGTVKPGRFGEDVLTLSEFETLFSGTVETIAASIDEIVLTIRDPAARLDVPIEANFYGGTGGLDGGDDLAGVAKPKGFGVCYNARPAPVDPVNGIYQLHDGAMNAVTEVRDSGVALSFDADVADITTATPATGEFATSLATGFIKLGAPPVGAVTADFEGDAAGSYVETVADLFERIAVTHGPLAASEVDTAALAAVDAAKPYVAGYYTGDRRPGVSSILDSLMASVDGYWTFTRAGLVTAGLYVSPEAETASVTLTSVDIADGRLELLATPNPIWRQSVGYHRQWTQQSEGELASGVSAEDRVLYGQPELLAADSNTSTKDVFRLAEELSISTLLAEEADAQTEATARLNRHRKVRRLYRFPAPRSLYLLDVGAVAGITHPRYGLEAGRNLLITGIEEDANGRDLIVTAWG